MEDNPATQSLRQAADRLLTLRENYTAAANRLAGALGDRILVEQRQWRDNPFANPLMQPPAGEQVPPALTAQPGNDILRPTQGFAARIVPGAPQSPLERRIRLFTNEVEDAREAYNHALQTAAQQHPLLARISQLEDPQEDLRILANGPSRQAARMIGELAEGVIAHADRAAAELRASPDRVWLLRPVLERAVRDSGLSAHSREAALAIQHGAAAERSQQNYEGALTWVGLTAFVFSLVVPLAGEGLAPAALDLAVNAADLTTNLLQVGEESRRAADSGSALDPDRAIGDQPGEDATLLNLVMVGGGAISVGTAALHFGQAARAVRAERAAQAARSLRAATEAENTPTQAARQVESGAAHPPPGGSGGQRPAGSSEQVTQARRTPGNTLPTAPGGQAVNAGDTNQPLRTTPAARLENYTRDTSAYRDAVIPPRTLNVQQQTQATDRAARTQLFEKRWLDTGLSPTYVRELIRADLTEYFVQRYLRYADAVANNPAATPAQIQQVTDMAGIIRDYARGAFAGLPDQLLEEARIIIQATHDPEQITALSRQLREREFELQLTSDILDHRRMAADGRLLSEEPLQAGNQSSFVLREQYRRQAFRDIGVQAGLGEPLDVTGAQGDFGAMVLGQGRPFFDLSFSNNPHGAYTHYFDLILAQRALIQNGLTEGAAGFLRRAGQSEINQSVWDLLFDYNAEFNQNANLHRFWNGNSPEQRNPNLLRLGRSQP
jgi:hypothetical protein